MKWTQRLMLFKRLLINVQLRLVDGSTVSGPILGVQEDFVTIDDRMLNVLDIPFTSIVFIAPVHVTHPTRQVPRKRKSK
ncbi:hypothetical protein [Paenibacillus protaetiae]|uniref:DUF2642 domain-containing protein n=1 Tax=Paenibacillus protaetiae TaxID=2509456 RepID=A0A4P6EXT7_9BACL|nr:hypothetical protein [Paenibacillus protaetiae]QAY68220.1 hypothetical protein ET464_19415 [Paenibacillus protaetiae]